MSLNDAAVSPDTVFKYITGAIDVGQFTTYLQQRLDGGECERVEGICKVYRQEFEPFGISREPPVFGSIAFTTRRALIESLSPAVLELLLGVNGFEMSQEPTDYLVGMHPESGGTGVQGRTSRICGSATSTSWCRSSPACRW